MLTSVDKFLLSLLPLVTMLGAWVGFDVTPEWWEAVAGAVSPVLVYLIGNKGYVKQ